LQHTLFAPGDTAASRLANQYQGAITNTQIAALIYLALVLLVITFLTNYAAQRVVKRFEFQRTGG
jgi:phosphate transport system permease protein